MVYFYDLTKAEQKAILQTRFYKKYECDLSEPLNITRLMDEDGNRYIGVQDLGTVTARIVLEG